MQSKRFGVSLEESNPGPAFRVFARAANDVGSLDVEKGIVARPAAAIKRSHHPFQEYVACGLAGFTYALVNSVVTDHRFPPITVVVREQDPNDVTSALSNKDEILNLDMASQILALVLVNHFKEMTTAIVRRGIFEELDVEINQAVDGSVLDRVDAVDRDATA